MNNDQVLTYYSDNMSYFDPDARVHLHHPSHSLFLGSLQVFRVSQM